MKGQHFYNLKLQWTGNTGQGTTNYRSYERSHTISIEGKKDILGSSDSTFRGDRARHNPEELFLASISSCHMLWYLHLCAEAGVVVVDYFDNATGTMQETEKGGGHFTEVTLHPNVTVSEKGMIAVSNELHKKANECCFIANSCNFPIHHNPTISSQNA
jgi:organic hydroperoxide reductase OsmC/OhrA